MKKVILVSIDGMRPDGFLNRKNPFCDKMMEPGAYSLSAKSINSSVTRVPEWEGRSVAE